jgi:hypothetical protein
VPCPYNFHSGTERISDDCHVNTKRTAQYIRPPIRTTISYRARTRRSGLIPEDSNILFRDAEAQNILRQDAAPASSF